MPQAIAGWIVTALGVGASTVVVAGIYAAVYVAFFAAAAHFAKQSARKSGLDTMSGLQQTVREPAAPRRIIYGRARVGGVLNYMGTTGVSNGLMHMGITLAGHECDGVEAVYVNDTLSDDARYLKAPGVDGATDVYFVRYGTSGRIFSTTLTAPGPIEGTTVEVDGTLMNPGGLDTDGTVFEVTGSLYNDGLYRVINATGREIYARRLDGGVFVDEPAGRPITIRERYLWTTAHLGEFDQAADADMMAQIPGWTSDHRLQGVAYLYVRMAYHANVWTAGLPNFSAVVRGKRVYDPRIGALIWSDNAALCIADYLCNELYGVGANYATEIDEDALVAAANICDEWVNVNGVNERRYTCNGAFDCNEPPATIIPKLASTLAGTVSYSGGKWVIRAGAYQAPTVTLTEQHLRGSMKVQPRLGRANLFNGVRGVFADSANDYQPTDFPAIQSAEAISEDNGEEIWTNIELPFTNTATEAQRLARIALNRARQQITVSYPCNLAGLLVRAGDTVAITNERMGWTGKAFEVIDWQLATYEDEQGAPLLGVDLTLRETAADVYGLGAVYAVDPSPDTDLPTPWEVATPTDLVLTSGEDEYQVQADGSVLSRMRVQWTESDDAVVGEYDMQYRREDDEAWTTVVVIGTYAYISPVYHGEIFEVRVRARNSLGGFSNWLHDTHTVVAADGSVLDAGKPIVPDVTGLTLTGQAVGVSEFTGPTLRVTWDKAGLLDPAVTDLWFLDYEVKVIHPASGSVMHTAYLTDNAFEYGIEQNTIDSAALALSGPQRALRVDVVVRGRQGQRSAVTASRTFTNPAPGLPSGWSVTTSPTTADAKFVLPTDLDLKSVALYLSATAGFTPGAGNLVWRGKDSVAPMVGLTPDTPYYYRYQSEDAFGAGDLSAELTFTTDPTVEMVVEDGSITAAKLADDAVQASKFAAGIEPVSIVTGGALPTTKTTEVIFYGGKLYRWSGTAYVATVPTTDLSGQVQAAQIAGLEASKVTGQLTDAQIAALAAAKLTGQITQTQITDGSISTAKLAATAVTAEKIAASAIVADKIASNAVTAVKINAGAVETAKLAAGSVVADKIATGAVVADKVAADAITAAKIAADAVTAGKIAAGAVSTDQLAASAVTADKIAAGTVTANKLAVSSRGGSLNRDPDFADINAWYSGHTQASSASANGFVATTVTDGKAGNRVLRLQESGTSSNDFFSERMPIDPTKTYRVSTWARQLTGDGRNYLAVAFYDAAGTLLTGSTSGGTGWTSLGTYNYWQVSNGKLPTAFTLYEHTFGPGGTATIPAGAAFCSIGALCGRDFATANDIQFQLYRLQEVVNGTLIENGAITTDKIAANAINAGKIAANSITTDKIATAGLSADVIKTGTLDASVVTVTKLNASNITSGTITGRTVQTAASGHRVTMSPTGEIQFHNSANQMASLRAPDNSTDRWVEADLLHVTTAFSFGNESDGLVRTHLDSASGSQSGALEVYYPSVAPAVQVTGNVRVVNDLTTVISSSFARAGVQLLTNDANAYPMIGFWRVGVDGVALYYAGGDTLRLISDTGAESTLTHSGLGVGEIGTHAMLVNKSGVSLAAGALIAASSLRYSNAGATELGTPAGTWRCLGYAGVGGTSAVSLFVRIA